jgi:hypothetical protein
MLKRMVLRLAEDVEAEHGLEQGRVREGDRLGWIRHEAERDHRILFLVKKLTRPSRVGTVASNEEVIVRDPGGGSGGALGLGTGR